MPWVALTIAIAVATGVETERRAGARAAALARRVLMTMLYVLAPFASRVPFQLQLIPRRPRARFEDDGPLGARLLHEVLGRLRSTLGKLPPINLWVRTAPHDAEAFCWRIEVVPRLTHLAGLELGAGVNLNILPPERAAAVLRDA